MLPTKLSTVSAPLARIALRRSRMRATFVNRPLSGLLDTPAPLTLMRRTRGSSAKTSDSGFENVIAVTVLPYATQ